MHACIFKCGFIGYSRQRKTGGLFSKVKSSWNKMKLEELIRGTFASSQGYA